MVFLKHPEDVQLELKIVDINTHSVLVNVF